MSRLTMKRDKRRGNVLIETALSFVVLFPIFYGTFQFGLAFLYYNELNSAVRAGARYAATKTYTSGTSTPTSGFYSDVINVAVYGNPTGGTTPAVRGLTAANVKLNVTFARGVPAAVTVSITNFRMNLLFQQMTLNKPSVTFPYFGHYEPPIT